MNSPRRWFWTATLAAATVAASCGAKSPSSAAPAFSATSLAGDAISLASLQGSVVLLDFWATWCPPCREQIPHLIDLHDAYRARGFTVIGASVDHNPGVVAPFVTQMGITYPVIMAEPAMSQAYKVRAIPTTVLIDQAGRIRRRYSGYLPKTVLERDIRQVLDEAPAKALL